MIALVAAVAVWMPSEAQLRMHDVATEFRHGRGIAVQRLDADCCKLAQAHADWMARGGGLNHGPNDQIIAYNMNGSFEASVTQCMQQWTGSPPHAAWLYGGFEKVGWGYAEAGGRRYFCGVFRGGSSTTTYTPNYYQPRRRWFRIRRRR